MSPYVFIAMLAAAAVIFIVYTLLTSGGKLRAALEDRFGKKPDADREPFRNSFWTEKLNNGDAVHYIDDMTWDDLDMDRVFALIDSCQSSAGEECLYTMLREPLFDAEPLLERERLIEHFSQNSRQRLDTQVCLHKLGKSDRGALASFCYRLSSKKVKHPNIYRLLAVLPLICACVIILNVTAGVCLLAAAIITNGVVYYKTNGMIDRELASVRYFSAMLWCAGRMVRSHALEAFAVGESIRKGYEKFKKLGGKLSGIGQQRVSDLDFLAEYFRIIFLSNIRNYNRIINMLEKNSEDFRRLYTDIGEVDAAIAVASFRKYLPFYCKPEFTERSLVNMTDVYHPLLSKPVPNSAELTGSIISGSNASGKSTFIKSAAVNGILAQTIHTCAAKSFVTRPALVMTSMAVRDSLTGGESYFITEIKSLRRIIRMIPHVFCACYIDEILKGTNTIERIAASASVLKFLSSMDCVRVVATHDIELTRMLAGYDNYHFGERITDSGVEFDYKINAGPSTTKNAIKLLEHMEFDERIVENAEELVRTFEQTQAWRVLE